MDSEFDILKDLFRNQQTKKGSSCNVHNDSFVSFCKDCREPMCVKCLLIHARSNETHDVKSMNELKNTLDSQLTSVLDQMKKGLDSIDKFKLEEPRENELSGSRQKGIDRIQNLRETVIQMVNNYFDKAHSNWVSLFDDHFLISKQKEQLVSELNLLVKMFLKARAQFNSLDKSKSLGYDDLQEILSTLGGLKSREALDKRIQSFMTRIERASRIQKLPTLAINKSSLSTFLDELKKILDYDFEQSSDKLNSRALAIRTQDTLKAINSSLSPAKNERNIDGTRLIPVVAKNRRMMAFDLAANSFRELPLSEVHSIPQATQMIVAPNQPNRCFLIGGHFFKKASGKSFEFDFMTGEFKSLPTMPTARWLHRCAIWKTMLFAIGGVEGDKEIATNSVELMDIESGNWSALPPLRVPRHSHALCILESSEKGVKNEMKNSAHVYAFGGIGANKQYVELIERFDIERGSWVEFPLKSCVSMQLVGPLATQINDKEIVVFGGLKYRRPIDEKNMESPNGTVWGFNNQTFFIINVEDGFMTMSDHFALPFGLLSTGNQLFTHQKKIYFVANLNTHSTFPEVQNVDYSEETNPHKIVGSLAKEKLDIIDYILFR